jgi:protein-tyrosine phosphatase
MKERIVKLETLYNFRELGGLPAAGGCRVKYGLLYRSGDLPQPSEADKAVLEALGLKTVVDFRGAFEASTVPDWLPSSVTRRYLVSIDAGNVMDFEAIQLKELSAEDVMDRIYASLIRDSQGAYRRLFELLADSANTPLLFHCSAGKDRTGVAAALLLSALGVERPIIYEDYILSARLLGSKYDYEVGTDYEAMYNVRSHYLESAFAVIDGEYGGTESYLRKQLGVDCEKLRGFYTEFC